MSCKRELPQTKASQGWARETSHGRIFLAALLCLLVTICSALVSAQQSKGGKAPAPPKKEVQIIAPQSSTTPLEGSITQGSEGVSIESATLSYKALTEISKEISSQIANQGGNIQNLIIYNKKDFDSLLQYKTFMLQTESLIKLYEASSEILASKNKPDSRKTRRLDFGEVIGAPSLATSLVKSGIDFLSLFRTNTELKSGNFIIPEASFVSLLSNELKSLKPGIRVFYQEVYFPWMLHPVSESPDSVVNRLATLGAYRAAAAVELSREGGDSSRTEGNENKARKPPASDQKSETLETLNAQVDSLLNSVMKPDEKTGTAPLSAIVKAESLYQLLKDENTSVLYLEVLQAGGTDRITRNLFRGSKLRYSGSAVAQYMLFDADGAIKLSKTIYCHTGFVNFDRPEGTNSRNNFETKARP